jgi:ribosomal protein S18 acetylase RimI-like enzyme
MNIELSEAPIASIAQLAQVPIAFTVERVYDVLPAGNGSGGFALSERPIETPYVKDYDGIPGEGPLQWARRFDVSNWGFIRAQSKARLIGGVVVAFNTSSIAMLEGRRDLAVLWDIRVLPDARGKGVGSGLLDAVEAWVIAKGGRQFKVETQNINVPACRFYQRHGFMLKTVDRYAYPELPGETQLLWYKNLCVSAPKPTGARAG